MEAAHAQHADFNDGWKPLLGLNLFAHFEITAWLSAVAALKIAPKCLFCNWHSHCISENKVVTRAGGDASIGIKGYKIMGHVLLKIYHKAPVYMAWVKTTH